MTRNTKLYKMKADGIEIVYRDLTAGELSILNNIKNDAVRAEKAADYAIISGAPTWTMKLEIGSTILTKSMDCVRDDTLFEITVAEFRDKVKTDFFLTACKNILSILPSMSFSELTQMTYKDIIELLCLCESITGKPLINIGDSLPSQDKKKSMSLINFSDLPADASRALQEQIRGLNGTM